MTEKGNKPSTEEKDRSRRRRRINPARSIKALASREVGDDDDYNIIILYVQTCVCVCVHNKIYIIVN